MLLREMHHLKNGATVNIDAQKRLLFKTVLNNRTAEERSPQATGIAEVDRKKISELLAILLADTYVLYLKTQNYHWNVTGPNFLTLHTMFMLQYNDLALAVDLIAERIRALGEPAPGSFLEFYELANVKEERGVQNAERMITVLNTDQEVLIKTIRGLMPMAEKSHDFTTVDLLTQRLQVHEKNAWMLSSFLK
jgi:starvation-inducible DNA-binding protein